MRLRRLCVLAALALVVSGCSAATLKAMRECGHATCGGREASEESFYTPRTSCAADTGKEACASRRGNDWAKCMRRLDDQCEQNAARGSRAAFAENCASVGGPLWAAAQLEGWTPEKMKPTTVYSGGLYADSSEVQNYCPQPDAAFITKWALHATFAIRSKMERCVSVPGAPFSKCEASLESAFNAERARRAAVLPAPATYEWADGNYGRDHGCEVWGSTNLSLTIDEWGDAQWSALSNSDMACESGVTTVPTRCGAQGIGHVEISPSGLRLVTTVRGQGGGGGTPSAVSLWQCGHLKVSMPLDWEPQQAMRRTCVRVGSAPDPVVERASEAACAYAPIFPELDATGVPLTVAGRDVTIARGDEVITLKNAPDAAGAQCDALRANVKEPVCEYGGQAGDWTCKMKGCPTIQLPGVEVGTRDTDPCRGFSALDGELMLERMRGVCDGSRRECERRSECIVKMRATLSAERNVCSCERPTPPGVRRSTVCSSKRWSAGGERPVMDLFGPTGDTCQLLTPW